MTISSSDIIGSGGSDSWTHWTTGGAGYGNIDADPLFDSANVTDPLSLLVGSPCIDAGDDSLVTGTTDILGNTRIQQVSVDMGAYETNY